MFCWVVSLSDEYLGFQQCGGRGITLYILAMWVYLSYMCMYLQDSDTLIFSRHLGLYKIKCFDSHKDFFQKTRRNQLKTDILHNVILCLLFVIGSSKRDLMSSQVVAGHSIVQHHSFAKNNPIIQDT